MLEYKDLVEYFASGCKPKKDFRFGLEWEQFSFNKETGKPLPYDGDISVSALLNKLIADYGWEAYQEKGITIALKRRTENGSVQTVSLEPGGQIELSGALQETVQEVKNEIFTFEKELTAAGDALGIGFKAYGLTPEWTREDFHLMPKQRYDIMTQYMPQKGNLGLDMMFRTCTVQLNIDYISEEDMVKKMRLGIAFQPLVTALFANSRILEGKDTGYASYRSHIWTDTDPDRTGILPFVFDEDFGFQRYTDYILDMPMYFIRRDGGYVNCAGMSFRDFMRGELPACMGEYPTMQDWDDHVSTAFPEVRLKKFIEMRGADSVPAEKAVTLAEFWNGLVYNDSCLDKCLAQIESWSVDDIQIMRLDAAKFGLEAKCPDGRTLAELYQELKQGSCIAA